MKLYRDRSELPRSPRTVVATIGNFDGVHCGHQWVIQRVIERARARKAASTAITFDPHPARVLRPGEAGLMLTPLNVKVRLLELCGLDEVLVLPFREQLARMSARAFAQEILQDDLNIVELHEGENFRFGYQAEAGVETLEMLGRDCGFSVAQYDARSMLGGPISSSRIRGLIAAGAVSSARKLLGRPFAVFSSPAAGRGYGTRYAVPTINLAPYAELLPANGVYVSRLSIGSGPDRKIFGGVTNIGNRPTFGADSFAVESHLFDFEPLALSEETPLKLTFLYRLRSEVQWPSVEALRVQIARDIARAKRYLQLSLLAGRPDVTTDPGHLVQA